MIWICEGANGFGNMTMHLCTMWFWLAAF